MTLGDSPDEISRVVTRYTVQETRQKLNILLAEDNIINQKLASELLRARGHYVVLASDGREALEAFKEGGHDLILMDVQMPEMDGLEATREIRKMEADPQSSIFNRQYSIPIVAMTAHAMKGDREKCLDAGMDDYISKPIKAETLFSVIEKYAKMTWNQKTGTPSPSTEDRETPDKEIFDLSKAMEMVLGKKDLFQEITHMFLENLPDFLGQIKEAVAKQDPEFLDRAAHGLKGSVGNFAAQRSYDAAYHLEKLGKNGKIQEAGSALANLEKELKLLEGALKTAIRG